MSLLGYNQLVMLILQRVRALLRDLASPGDRAPPGGRPRRGLAHPGPRREHGRGRPGGYPWPHGPQIVI